jgi:hypothetical protein
MVVSTFSGIIQFCVGACLSEKSWGCEAIKYNGIRSPQTFESFDGNQTGVAGSCPNEQYFSYWVVAFVFGGV